MKLIFVNQEMKEFRQLGKGVYDNNLEMNIIILRTPFSHKKDECETKKKKKARNRYRKPFPQARQFVLDIFSLPLPLGDSSVVLNKAHVAYVLI